jgi:hypothetical protein
LASAAGASITPSKVSANRQNGFSIVSYSASNADGKVAHGLSKTPEMVIVKCTNGIENWIVKHKDLSGGQYLMLNHPNSVDSNGSMFTSNADTDGYFWVGNNNATNNSSQNYIAYLFHSVAGYSKIGSWYSNASSTGNGNFIYTGFKPSWIMMKATNRSSFTTYASWLIFDNARSPHNAVKGDNTLYANRPYTEGKRGEGSDASGDWVDFLSNGFKIKTDAAEIGGNGHTGPIIYVAFSEQPFSGPSNAR